MQNPFDFFLTAGGGVETTDGTLNDMTELFLGIGAGVDFPLTKGVDFTIAYRKNIYKEQPAALPTSNPEDGRVSLGFTVDLTDKK